MTNEEANRVNLLIQLIAHGCLKIGQFTLKSGEISPYYLDLRTIISSSTLLSSVADAYVSILDNIKFDRIAAIPLAALPIATAVCLKMKVPLIYPRMITKEHGTKNNIEGEFKPTDRITLIDDVISSAKSKLEAIDVLKNAGLNVTDVIVLVDRESGGKEELEKHGFKLHSYAKISELLSFADAKY